MKKLSIILFILVNSIFTFAQQGINYKAIIKDVSGNVLSNSYMTIQFSIHQNTETGTVVYQEDHNYTTDANGLVILSIGTDITPSIGDFNSIAWGKYAHFLQTSVTYSGGTINFDATEFMSVPYAKHAEIAAVAENVFSGDYNDLINQPNTIPTGLESIDEGNGKGWRLIGKNPENYGEIGSGAVDLSFSVENSDLYGATGYASFAMGVLTEASGQYSTVMGVDAIASGYASTAMGSRTEASGEVSTAMGAVTVASGVASTAMGSATQASSYASTAMGYFTKASGYNSVAMGALTNAESLNSLVIGQYNIGGGSSDLWVATDPLFEIGNGLDQDNKNNALTVLKNGNTIFDAEVHTKNTGNANMLPIAYGLVESNGNILNGTGNFTASITGNVFTINIDNETFTHENNVCFITPISGGFRTSSISSSGGNVTVRIFNSDGNTSSTSFQFMVYKL
ncbi:hypothetical protein [Algibacter lectus]|uniref:Outer membrane protein n=1 Tax=Algibacter lectus TaxID=221126 RepID=A0A090VDW6_9FLAO|nr:hypothetical protein [Algibacter lectus]GAL61554.1 outer membrane protein [Algibacter lectus]